MPMPGRGAPARPRPPGWGPAAPPRSTPPIVFALTREKVTAFLSRLLACTATVAVDPEISVRCTLPSVRTAEQVRHLLLRYGVPSSVEETVLLVAPAQAQALFREGGIIGWERLRTWARDDHGRDRKSVVTGQ